MDIFDKIWDQLAERGMCDDRGGMEYTRCRELWECFDCYTAITASILVNANAQPRERTAPPNADLDK